MSEPIVYYVQFQLEGEWVDVVQAFPLEFLPGFIKPWGSRAEVERYYQLMLERRPARLVTWDHRHCVDLWHSPFVSRSQDPRIHRFEADRLDREWEQRRREDANEIATELQAQGRDGGVYK